MLFPRVLILLLLLALVVPVHAAECSDDHPDRPKIGLALSGGGARGGAHVGVLKALEEMNIPIDYIAGTSMGAIVGGFYAAGYSADEIKALMLKLDWKAAFTDKPARRNQTMRKKELEAEFLIPYRIGFNKGSMQLPLGVIEGQHLDQIFHRILLAVQGTSDFDQLPIPFRAVATDLVTGKEVVLSAGSLPDALRASMSVPGVFAPVRLNDQLLVDGGMANNLPVSVVRTMGADIVIAVDISSPLLKEEQLKSVLSVTEQLTSFLTRSNTERQIALLCPDDVLLVPNLEGFSSADFQSAGKVAEIGYQTAMSERQSLASLTTPAGQAPMRPGPAEQDPQHYVVQFVDINNHSVLDDEIIRSRLDLELNQPLDLSALEKSIDRIYSLDVFESVTYNLVQSEQGETGVQVNAMPRSWGPNYLQFGLEFSNDFSGSSDFKLGGAYTRNALNSLGGELRVVAAIGREDELTFNFYQPINKQARWFVESELFARRQRYNVWEEDVHIATLDIAGLGATVGIGRNFSTTDLVRLDYEIFRGDADVVTGVLDFPLDDKVDIGELRFEYRHDSLDSLWFPTSGTFHRLGFRYADESLGASIDYEQAMASGSFAFSKGKNTVLLNYDLGYSFDDAAPVERWFELGGFGRLSGLVPDQLSGRQLGFASLAYLRRLNDVDLVPAYAGITLEAGNVWQYSDDMSFGDLRKSGSIFIGAKTPIGPVYLAWGYSDNGESTAYFYLGNPFRRIRF
jgi:NTE family protein